MAHYLLSMCSIKIAYHSGIEVLLLLGSWEVFVWSAVWRFKVALNHKIGESETRISLENAALAFIRASHLLPSAFFHDLLGFSTMRNGRVKF